MTVTVEEKKVLKSLIKLQETTWS